VRWLMLLIVAVVLVVTPTCGSLQNECAIDSDCNDGNPCTEDDCKFWWTGEWNPDRGWCSDHTTYLRCMHRGDDDGTPCEVDGQTGVCESGECQLEGETLDGGV
jgi:hypothetical protein